jgi:hypothetical protein
VGLEKELNLENKGEYTRRTDRSHFWMLLSAQRNMKINSDEKHEIFAHKLQSAWRLTVGFSKVYCKL